MVKKSVIVDTYIEVTDYDLEKTIKNLQKLQEQYSKKFTNLRLEYEWGYDNQEKIVLKGDRDETSEEEAKRLEQENIYKENRRREYERLKKEFE